MKKLSVVLFSVLMLFAVLMIAGCGEDGDVVDGGGGGYATIIGTLTLPENASGKKYVVLVDENADGDDGYVKATEGTCGSGNFVNYSISEVPAGKYCVYAVVRNISANDQEPKTGDYLGIYGLSLYDTSVAPNATVPSSGTATFDITTGIFDSQTGQIYLLNSSTFESGGAIPQKYTCDGDDISPPLKWAYPPLFLLVGSYVLIVDDIDAGDFTHWVAYDIPSNVSGFSEGSVPAGIKQGQNDFGGTGYGGPCPPSGTHRYRFRLYPLYANTLGLADGASRAEVESAMQNSVMGPAILIGEYKR